MDATEEPISDIPQFLGHDNCVHREYYCLPSDAVKMAKVAKILIAMENGQQQQLSGQSLDEISVNLNEGDYAIVL